ncbi:imidazolonepropionase [Deinococcus yavapaiensis]|uniref:Imidazolonepropionase n=1 Tax=Deinococcus yavapaiensis KR-236 TaxID=694435 RepID=A0A318S4Y1_9DEIO|nr:imidazolonepropionase [Deinococcus yavapaiensis]PYE53137.1 imidazolonepropionase [Deinococcus yavapaiensis KR-236]
MSSLFTNISEVVTPTLGAKRGRAMRDLTVTRDAAMLVEGGRVVWIGARKDAPIGHAERDLGGVAVVPGLVDPHTHLVWAGNRLADFEARTSGVTYEEILRRGGGIRSTAAATRAASEEALVASSRPRLTALAASGATTIEIKSGYALDVDGELKMLRAIGALRDSSRVTVTPTLLLHVPQGDRSAYLRDVCEPLVEIAAREGLAEAVDVFCEREAFTVEETARLFDAARRAGLRVKLHADQFHAIGGTKLACDARASSVDHLEASGSAEIRLLAESSTVATILPGVSLHLGLPSAPGRALVDAGAVVAVGTDANPGSSPLLSAPLALALAVRLNGLTPSEALTAGTVNAAAALDLHDRGALAPGCKADFLALRSDDWRDLVYILGASPVRDVFVNGEVLEADV